MDGNMMELKKVEGWGHYLVYRDRVKKLFKGWYYTGLCNYYRWGKYTYPQTAELTEKNIPLLYLSTVYYRILQEYPGDTYLI